MRRPSPATGIALVALFISLSGTAYAATGGAFLLGKSNTANAVTSLSNNKGMALSLSSKSSTPPLSVSNSVEVPNLNASELNGNTSSAFLPVTGTAANSSELGGQPPSAYLSANGTAANSNELGGTPASGYMQGGGNDVDNQLSLTGSTHSSLLITPTSGFEAYCDNGATGTSISVNNFASGEAAVWWNKDGVGNTSPLSVQFVTPGEGSTATYVVVVPIDDDTAVTRFTGSEWYVSGSNTCYFSAQAVTTNG